MSDGDTRESGPLSIDQLLDQRTAPEEGQAEPVEEETPDPKPEAVEGEVEAEAEADAESDETDEPEAEDEAPAVYSIDEYGEIAVALADGTQTTLKDLAQGNLRQADYSRKTAELSKERKALEAEKQELAARERQLDEAAISQDDAEPDWFKMAEEDPLGWQTEKLRWDRQQAAKEAKRQKVAEARQKEAAEFREWTASLAVEKVPEWSEQGVFAKTADARKRVALDAGFTPQEYESAIDFRFAVLLEKAARYDAGQTKVAAATKKLAKVPQVVKPGAAVSKSEREAASKAAKSKRLDRPMSVQEYLDIKSG